ncbi:hypothetical protein Tco_0609939 [Tanacetum coccineum]
MPPANNGSTEDVQPPVVQIQSRNPNLEPIVAPVVAPVPNTKPTVSLPYPSRRDNEKSPNSSVDEPTEVNSRNCLPISESYHHHEQKHSALRTTALCISLAKKDAIARLLMRSPPPIYLYIKVNDTKEPITSQRSSDQIGNPNARIGEDLRSEYQQKDRKPSQNDKTEHGMEKTVQNQGQSPKMTKSESILKNQQDKPGGGMRTKNTIGFNLNPSVWAGKAQ